MHSPLSSLSLRNRLSPDLNASEFQAHRPCLLGAKRRFHFSTDISSGRKTARAADRLTSKPSFFKRYAEEALYQKLGMGLSFPLCPLWRKRLLAC